MIPANTTAECWGKVFSSCSSLSTIVVSKNNAEYKSINNSILSKDGKELLLCRSAIIPEGVTMIAKLAFEGCNLTEIEIPEGVTAIGDEAFYLCYELRSIKIPDSVKAIGYAAFQECEYLQSIVIPDGVREIEDYTFCCCANLQSIEIPQTVTVIGMHAFSGCGSLQSIVIPDGVTVIKEGLFSGCHSLQSIEIPDELIVIEDDVFEDCDLQSVTIKTLEKDPNLSYKNIQFILQALSEISKPLEINLRVPIGCGYAYQHYSRFAGKLKNIIADVID